MVCCKFKATKGFHAMTTRFVYMAWALSCVGLWKLSFASSWIQKKKIMPLLHKEEHEKKFLAYLVHQWTITQATVKKIAAYCSSKSSWHTQCDDIEPRDEGEWRELPVVLPVAFCAANFCWSCCCSWSMAALWLFFRVDIVCRCASCRADSSCWCRSTSSANCLCKSCHTYI